jgi:ribonucleotide monophosphatase NagD (HAD superfamily)
VRDKRRLTQELIKLLPESQQDTVESMLPVWWFNLRKNGGMRLTGIGFNAFVKDLKLENYEYNIDDPLQFNQHVILKLDRKLQMPYYIHAIKGIPKKIVFFGSRDAVMANLYGNLKQFLDNY